MPKKNQAFILYTSLVSQSNPFIMQANPTLAAGDLKVSIDGGALNNLATLPTVTPAAGKMVKISLSATEMNGTNITVVCSDASGAEWQDQTINILTSVRDIDDVLPTSSYTTPPTVGAITDAVWDEVLTGATHNVPTSAGRRLRQVTASIIIDGMAQGAGTGNNQIQLANDASSVNGTYDPGLVYIVSGAGIGQSRIILEYNGATRTATVNRDWKVAPDATSEYVIAAYADLQCVNEGLVRAATANTIQLNALASTDDDAYNGQAVFIVSGTGQDQLAVIRDYDGATQTATTYCTLATTPDTTSGYVMLPLGLAPILSLMYDYQGTPTPIVIPPPALSNVCRVYEFAYIQSGASPLSTVTATAQIIDLPFDYDGKLHAGTSVTALTTTPDGQGNYAIYWDLPYTSTVTIYVKEHGVQHQITVPSTTTARLADLI